MENRFRNLLKQEFIKYCQENDLKRAEACLTLDVDVNTVSEDGHWSGLTVAAYKNYKDLLEILLSHPQIKINNTTDPGVVYAGLSGRQLTALMFASRAGNSAIVSRLVQVPGLDINYQDKYGVTAAHLASGWGHTEYVRILAETGKVDWNKRNKWGSPLYWALYSGNSDIVEIIVKQSNIDYNIKNDDGETLAQRSVINGNVKSVETLADQEECQCWNVPDTDGNTPALKALKENKMDILKILLKCPRVDLSCRDADGWSLLFRAIAMKNRDLVNRILSKMGQDVTGKTLARIAVEMGGDEDVRRLVEAGTVDWNEKVQGEDPAIFWALNNERFEMVKILLKCPRIDLKMRDWNNCSLEKNAREKELKEILDLIPGTIEFRMRQIEESARNVSLDQKIPECPVCFEKFPKDGRIFSCSNGHFLCGSCMSHDSIRVCPKCKKDFVGRAHDFEEVVNTLWE